MSITTLALMSALGTFLTFSLNYVFGMCMLERPIVVGTVVGILLGDIPTGVMIGAALEVAFMGIVNIGGVTATDASSSTAVATAFAIFSGLSIEEAVAIAIPIGIVANAVFSLGAQISNLGSPFLDKICEKGDQKALYVYEFIMFFIVFAIKPLVVGIAVFAGAGPVEALISSIPASISAGINAAGGLLGALGMAMLMRMLWSKEIAAFYFLGFVLVKYLNVPTMGITVIAAVIAIVTGLREMQLIKLEKGMGAGLQTAKVIATKEEEEEDFLA